MTITRRASVALALAAVLLAAPAQVARAQDPTVAPATTLSNGGRTVSDGVRSLSVSQVTDLDPNGQSISISVAGFAPEKGIYVAFCVIPPTNQQPTPCGGGNPNAGGSAGSSLWLRSDDYGAQNSATPFGPGGTHTATFGVKAIIDLPAEQRTLDCRQLRCAIVTRADHKAISDRSLDMFVPLTFAAESPAVTTPTSAPPPPPPAPTTTIAALQPTSIAPTTTVAGDGLSVGDGTRRLAADQVVDLDPEGAAVTVEGRGFDAAKGIFVGLCVVPSPDPALPAGAATPPGPCSAPAEGGSAWVSSTPPDYGQDIASPYDPGGAFDESLTLRAVIDEDHDCRVVACALVSRNDDTNAADRTQDLYLPVTFDATTVADDAEETDEPETASVEVDDDDDDGGVGALPLVGGGTAVAVVAALGVARWRKRAAT